MCVESLMNFSLPDEKLVAYVRDHRRIIYAVRKAMSRAICQVVGASHLMTLPDTLVFAARSKREFVSTRHGDSKYQGNPVSSYLKKLRYLQITEVCKSE